MKNYDKYCEITLHSQAVGDRETGKTKPTIAASAASTSVRRRRLPQEEGEPREIHRGEAPMWNVLGSQRWSHQMKLGINVEISIGQGQVNTALTFLHLLMFHLSRSVWKRVWGYTLCHLHAPGKVSPAFPPSLSLYLLCKVRYACAAREQHARWFSGV